MQTQPKIPEISKYQHYINCCAALGITGTVDNLNQMLSVDYLISNEDRHFNNFGVIRNAETLEWIDFAPIFDCGTSMWFDHNTFVIGQNDISKPFEKTHSEQIALVKSYDFLDFEKIADIADMCYEIYKSSPFIDDERLKWLCHWTGRRMELLKGIAPGCTQRYGITMQ
jgi:hypothetical protein